MKGFFTLLVALIISVTVNAQTKLKGMELAPDMVTKCPQSGPIVPRSERVKAVPSRIKVDEGEHLMGFYNTDDLPDLSYGGYLGWSITGNTPVANLFDEDVTDKFVNGEIVRFRFAVGCDVEVLNAFIYTYDIDGPSEEPVAYVDISSTLSAGWYDVELPEPVTIEADMDYLIGYEYVQVSGSYPVVTDMELNVDVVSSYGFCIYTNLGYGATWYSMGSSYGALCLQAVVRGGRFIDEDISLRNLSANKYVSSDKSLPFSFSIRNEGNLTPESYLLNVAVDGTVVETIDSPLALTSVYQTVSGTLSVSELSPGNHTLTVSVAEINGVAPEENTNDDVVEASFLVYEGEGVARQMHLIEYFTSVRCTYCYLGQAILDALQSNNPDKYAWVSLHYYMSGTDPYSLDDADYIASFSGLTGYPSAAFDRYILDDDELNEYKTIAIPLGYYTQYSNYVATQINNAVDAAYDNIPAFVSVDISPEYDESSRQLTIKVSGEGVTGAQDVLEGNRLTVYLTEDDINGSQLSNGVWDYDYQHFHVLRMIASYYPWGDDINWTSDSSYENTLNVTLGTGWNPDNMHVVAFISGPMAVLIGGSWYYGEESEAFVNNANSVKLTDNPSGIVSVANDPNAGISSFYTIDGRRVDAPIKGVNIVKQSDGTTKKVVVK